MYIKAINGVVEKFPYSIGQLRKDNPQVSFPKNPSNELLAEWNVYPVEPHMAPHVDVTKRVTQGIPVNNNGWHQTWYIENKSNDEISQQVEHDKNQVRNTRNQLLADTDWIVIKSLETNSDFTDWKMYRQELRDITSQETFPDVIWPTKPE